MTAREDRERSANLAATAARMLMIANNKRLPSRIRYEAIVRADHALELAEQFEALAREKAA